MPFQAMAATDETPTDETTTDETPTTSADILPPYPEVEGFTHTEVAIAVVVVLFGALQIAATDPLYQPLVPALYELLAAAWVRLTEIAYNNLPQAPETTGELVGNFNATDPDGDPLAYTVTTEPQKGTVVVDALGNYDYTPSASFIRDGGEDTFTVTIDDTLGGYQHFNAPNGHSITRDVTISVVGTGINVPPEPTARQLDPQGDRDSIGVVRGRVGVVDPDDETHTFSLAGNSAGATATSAYSSLGGIVSLDSTTGDWTYVPAVAGQRGRRSDHRR